MPGFNLTWHYNKNISAEPIFQSEINKEFVRSDKKIQVYLLHFAFRFINILILLQDDQDIVKENVRKIRKELGNFRASQPQFSIKT